MLPLARVRLPPRVKVPVPPRLAESVPTACTLTAPATLPLSIVPPATVSRPVLLRAPVTARMTV